MCCYNFVKNPIRSAHKIFIAYRTFYWYLRKIFYALSTIRMRLSEKYEFSNIRELYKKSRVFIRKMYIKKTRWTSTMMRNARFAKKTINSVIYRKQTYFI